MPGAAECLSAAEVRSGSLTGCTANAREIGSSALMGEPCGLQVSLTTDPILALSRLPLPIHVVVPERARRRYSDGVVCHVCQGAIPSGGLVELMPRVFVTSPALTFLQVAPTLSVTRAARLAFEPAGTYALGASTQDRDCLYGQTPLSCVADLRSTVGSLPAGTRGRSHALRALRFALDGAASPREADLVLLLCLPHSLGGHGLPFPELNHRIDLDPRARSIARRSYCVADLFWEEAGIDVEYHGADFHTGLSRLESDTGRQAALESMGIKVIGVSNAQLEDPSALDGIASMLAQRLCLRLRGTRYDLDERRRRLRWDLLGV
ncbi:MAG: hypothetical protein LKG13_02910 [Atopobiaceae bacterium]|nr:hypothetical protein [Atopobiaceae bacterium]